MSSERYARLFFRAHDVGVSLDEAAYMVNYELREGLATEESAMVARGPRNLDVRHDGVANGMMSVFADAWSKDPVGEVGLPELADGVMRSDSLRHRISHLRSLDREAYRSQKLHLPGVSVAGTFAYLNKPGLLSLSGYVIVDVDERADAYEIRRSLRGEESVGLAFVSPSEHGVKIIVAVDPAPADQDHYESACVFVGAVMQRRLGVKVDAPGRDVPRLCFLSHDADAVYNPEPVGLKWRSAPHVEFEPRDYSDLKMDDPQITKALEAIPASDYHTWFRVGAALHRDFGEAGFELFDGWSASDAKYDRDDVLRKWNAVGSCDQIGVGTVFWLARSYGWRN